MITVEIQDQFINDISVIEAIITALYSRGILDYNHHLLYLIDKNIESILQQPTFQESTVLHLLHFRLIKIICSLSSVNIISKSISSYLSDYHIDEESLLDNSVLPLNAADLL